MTHYNPPLALKVVKVEKEKLALFCFWSNQAYDLFTGNPSYLKHDNPQHYEKTYSYNYCKWQEIGVNVERLIVRENNSNVGICAPTVRASELGRVCKSYENTWNECRVIASHRYDLIRVHVVNYSSRVISLLGVAYLKTTNWSRVKLIGQRARY